MKEWDILEYPLCERVYRFSLLNPYSGELFLFKPSRLNLQFIHLNTYVMGLPPLEIF